MLSPHRFWGRVRCTGDRDSPTYTGRPRLPRGASTAGKSVPVSQLSTNTREGLVVGKVREGVYPVCEGGK